MIDVVGRFGLVMNGVKDNAPALAELASYIAGLSAQKTAMPRLVFTEGDLAFSVWPDLAYDNLQIIAEGECRLRPQGMASIVFDGSLRNPISAQPNNTFQPSVNNMLFEGFDIYPPVTGAIPLVFRGIHRSKLSARVQFEGPVAPGRVAIRMTFCIITELHPVVGGGGGNQSVVGLWLDAWPGKPNLQSTASTIWNPCLEGCSTGIDMESAGSCAVYNGTIESCGLGVHLGAASGNNVFYSVEMEGNGTDVKADGGAHANGFLYCGNASKLSTNFGLFSTNWARN